MSLSVSGFREIWCVDFEFTAPPGEQPRPVCLVGIEICSGREIQLWEDELRGRKTPPYSVGPDSLLVAYYCPAELGCHLALGWSHPVNVLDLYAEFRNYANGRPVPCGYGLLGALVFFGLDSMDAAEKESMRALVIRGGPWTCDEQEALLGYCRSDVVSLGKLLRRMLPQIDLLRALLRGRYMKAVARMEQCGVPIDTEALSALRHYWPDIKNHLIDKVNCICPVFEGRTFRRALFKRWLIQTGRSWPTLPSGNLALDDDTFRERARSDPEIAVLREVRGALSRMRLLDLSVGSDRRNRCLLSPFRSRTGRNQPSNTRFIFGPSVWLRSLIRPDGGQALAYLDFSQQEFGIADALSRDSQMMEAYRSRDPYLSFAKQGGAVPENATSKSHPLQRNLFKACVLAVQYGMGAKSLAERINQSELEARNLLATHRRTYPRFWSWSDAAVDHAMLTGRLWTVFGWTIHVAGEVNPRFLRNFPMQANGAEMLRLACCLATERGIRVCAPVHDAILIEAPVGGLSEAVRVATSAMGEASELVLGGFRLRTDVREFRHPDRYDDPRGREMWGAGPGDHFRVQEERSRV